MKRGCRWAWALWGLICLLGLAGCAAAPRARGAAYRELAAWLEAHALPGESVAVQEQRSWARLTDHPVKPLPAGGDAFVLLEQLEAERPDYCVASRSVAWEGVGAASWFQEHYRQVAIAAAAEDPASPLTLYRYQLSPFDAGEVLHL